LFSKLSTTWGRAGTWPERAIWALDHRLRERQGIYEYTDRADCLFRIQRERAPHSFLFADGTRVGTGDPIIGLHLWNEHIPTMGRRGPTVVWARRTLRAMDASLRELASFLQRRNEYDNVAAFYGNMCLGTASQCEQLARIVAHYGFEVIANREAPFSGSLHQLGQSILIALLALATNPASLRTAVLRRFRERLILSRATLESRYGAGVSLPASWVLPARCPSCTYLRAGTTTHALASAGCRSERMPVAPLPGSTARRPPSLHR
jgi:hypothetical protein